ncbi:MAG: hypothetical protein KKH92_00360 [Firmicutes bacterium]|nr:hypothetical protein [Bacillota bacterium]
MKININRETLKSIQGSASFKKDIRASLKKYKGKLAVDQLVFFCLSQDIRKGNQKHE